MIIINMTIPSYFQRIYSYYRQSRKTKIVDGIIVQGSPTLTDGRIMTDNKSSAKLKEANKTFFFNLKNIFHINIYFLQDT